ncbi:unnamed protein product [Paramecium primaurelia]|uniref:C2 NT-type domain-containing protein n=1 Tax=Paramecium primaurelia TaxID=5886 RepID=A0A8S1M7K8_PARPR|nr:unnamed protein product [Paramecium primaurelia]
MFKHAGTSENKALIEVNIHQLNINITVPNCEVMIVFQRGDRKAQTQPIQLLNKCAKIDQILRVPATLYYDVKQKEYQKKMGTLIVLIKYEKGMKNAGQIDIDFSSYLNQKKGKIDEISPLSKCPDPNATLSYTINFLSQDQRSKTPEANINNIREDQSKAQITQLDQQNKQMKEDNIRLQEEVEHLRTQNKQQQIYIQQLLNQTKQFQETQLNQNQSKSNSETPTTQPEDCQKCLQYQLELEQLKKQKKPKPLNCDKCINLEQQIEQIKKQYSQGLKQENNDQKFELLNQANTDLKEQLYELEQQAARIRKENQDLKNKLTIQNQQLIDCRERIQELENDDESDKRILEYQKLIEKSNDDLLDIQQKLFSFQTECDQLQREKNEYEQQLEIVSKKYDTLELQLFQQKQRFANAMHTFLSLGDTNAIEVLEKFSGD